MKMGHDHDMFSAFLPLLSLAPYGAGVGGIINTRKGKEGKV